LVARAAAVSLIGAAASSGQGAAASTAWGQAARLTRTAGIGVACILRLRWYRYLRVNIVLNNLVLIWWIGGGRCVNVPNEQELCS